MRKRKLLMVAVVLLAALSGCTGDGAEESDSSTVETTESIPDDVTRFVDEEAGVVCYQFHAAPGSRASSGGIACVPITETKLSE